MGFPSPSTIAWIFVVFPPRLVPINWLYSEFTAPFLLLRFADVLLSKCCRYSDFPYRHLRSRHGKQSPAFHRHATCRICCIRFDGEDTGWEYLPMQSHCVRARGWHSAWSCYPISRVGLFALPGKDTGCVPIPHR